MPFLIALIGYIGLTIYLANQEELTGKSKKNHPRTVSTVNILLYGSVALIFLTGLMVLLYALGGDSLEEQNADTVVPEIGPITATLTVLDTGILAMIAFSMIRSVNTRRGLQFWVGRSGYYRPDSIVHTTAVVFCLLLLAGQVFTLVLQGGISGMAEAIEEEGIPPGEVIMQLLLQIAVAFLGIGWAIRRSLPQALDRLGLRMPTGDDLLQGLLFGLFLFGLTILYGIAIAVLSSLGIGTEQQWTEQNEAANSLAQAFATIPLALLLSASAAIGEEILFRGALQPVFGNILTSAFFALMHTQNFASPSLLLIFAVSYTLGRLRERHSTVAAMIGHFVYNFIQLALLIWVTSMGATTQ